MIMNNSLTIIISGNPLGKIRSRKGSQGAWYNPQEDIMRINERKVKEQLPDGFSIIKKNIPVIVNLIAFFLPLKKEITKEFLEKIQNEDVYYTHKPDRDNIDKFVLDILSGIVFCDDDHVCDGSIQKYYTPDNPRIEVEILW